MFTHSENPAEPAPSNVTTLLNRMRNGDSEAGDQVAGLVYSELHRIASREMRREGQGHTLQTTALVHEAYLKLAGAQSLEIQDRAHFYAVASQQMRRILVDHARSNGAQRRGGGAIQVELDHLRIAAPESDIDVLLLDESLRELERLDPRAAKVVELRYFGGYTDKEVVEALGVSLGTIRRDWEFARSWLFERMQGKPGASVTPELHGQVRSLFDEALERPEADRLPFLRSACSGDTELLQAVVRLLEAHRGSQNFLEHQNRSTRRIGRYLVTGELGRGAMGVVYDAIDPVIGRKVAVKVIHLPAVADPNETAFLRDRLFREARSAGLLSHPGIVAVFDVGQEGDLAFIAMERVEGVSLFQMLASGRGLPRAQALDILMQTAAALDYAHRSGVVHRDIKPENIIVDHAGYAKIADLGIARIVSTDRHTVTGVVMGTPIYMSPEQIEAQPYDGRADQFSLAVVAYELLTGRRPFHADSLATLVHMIVYAERPSACAVNPWLPPPVDAVLRRGLARFPNDRYPSSTHFAQALAEASNGIWQPAAQPMAPAPVGGQKRHAQNGSRPHIRRRRHRPIGVVHRLRSLSIVSSQTAADPHSSHAEAGCST